MIVGFVIGVAISCVAIWWTMRGLRRVSVRGLMAGTSGDSPALDTKRTSLWTYVAGALVVVAVGLAVLATRLGGEAQAGAFFGAGAAILTALLLWIWSRLRGGSAASDSAFGVIGLAARNAGRNPGRSTLTIGLVAASSFLIIAISAFRLTPTSQGAGGARWVGESSQPLFVNWTDPVDLEQKLGAEAELVAETAVLPLPSSTPVGTIVPALPSAPLGRGVW